MSDKPMTWQRLAILLGERMRHHAHCTDHNRNEADPHNCPFCADRAAFDAYITKMGKKPDGSAH